FLLIALLSVGRFTTEAQSSGRFTRGTGTNASLQSFVIPLDSEQGVTAAPSLATTLSGMAVPALYHLDATNTGSPDFSTNRLQITNAVAAFGAKYGGSPLYYGQNYRFGAYAGDTVWGPDLLVTIVNRTTGAFVSQTQLPLSE